MIGQLYSVVAENLTVGVNTDDFFQLRGAAGAYALVHEIRVWQRGSGDVIEGVRLIFRRGTGGATGTALSAFEYNTGGSVPIFQAFSLPGTNASSLDWDATTPWLTVQEAVFVPTEEIQIPLKVNDDLGIGTADFAPLSGVGVFIAWEEFPD